MNTPKKNQSEIDNLYSNTSITKLGEYCLVQANLNINQILEIRNTTISPSKSNELRKKEQVFNSLNSPWIIEIVHKGAMCDALVEIWCIEMISQNYTSEEAIKNQVNYKRFDLLGRTIPWMGITFPCWTEHKKGGDKKQLFEAKLRLPNHDGKIDKPLLGIYECPNSKDQPCQKCQALGRKCTLTSPGISPSVNDDPNFYIDYAKDPNNQAFCTMIGQIKTQLGDYRVQTIYFNDRIHNNMINKSVVTKSPAINLPKNLENPEIATKSPVIIMDYKPTQKRPQPSTPPSHNKAISPSTSPIPVHHMPKPVQSDHGKSAPMNIHANVDTYPFPSRDIGTSKSSFSFDKELGEIFATSPNSLALPVGNSPLWKTKRANNSTTTNDEKERDECFQPGSPRPKLERRRSQRKSISTGSFAIQSGTEEIQFLIDTSDPVSNKPTTSPNDVVRSKEYDLASEFGDS